MPSRTRVASVIVFLAIAVLVVFTVIDRSRAGQPSVNLVPDGQIANHRFLIKDAPAGDPLHAGDRVVIDDPVTLAKLVYGDFTIGSTVLVRRVYPLPETMIAARIQPAKTPSFSLMVVVVELMFLGIAALIVLRGRANGALQLGWFLALLVPLFNPTSPAWPDYAILTYAIVGGAIGIIAFTAAANFATRIAGDPESPWARRSRRLTLGIGVVAVVIDLATAINSYTQPTTPLWIQRVGVTAFFFQALRFIVIAVIVYFKAPENERQRVSWVGASLGVGVAGLLATIGLTALQVPEPLRDYPLLLLIAMPFGCAYAILRYRLLDIGFVINRATVFGITSLLVLALLALVDFGLQSLLGSWLQRTGLYVQLTLALAIGIATRPLHERIDALVDDLFFRKRNEAERTLRQFARDVTHIDDPSVVLARTVEIVARAAELRCAVYLATDGEGYTFAAGDAVDAAPQVDRNDESVVRMLATREPVDLHDVRTALAGDFAFPMFARNRLLGMLVCGGKADGVTAYAPDELHAIGGAALASGVSLDLLRIEALERELATLRAL